jgi:hypothetical protein
LRTKPLAAGILAAYTKILVTHSIFYSTYLNSLLQRNDDLHAANSYHSYNTEVGRNLVGTSIRFFRTNKIYYFKIEQINKLNL